MGISNSITAAHNLVPGLQTALKSGTPLQAADATASILDELGRRPVGNFALRVVGREPFDDAKSAWTAFRQAELTFNTAAINAPGGAPGIRHYNPSVTPEDAPSVGREAALKGIGLLEKAYQGLPRLAR